MPGAITDPNKNNFQSYLEWSNGSPTAEADYQSGLSKGYQWTGAGWKFGGGTDQTNWTDAMKKGAAQASDGRWGAGGAPMSGPSGLSGGSGGGMGGPGGSSMSFGSSFGGKNPFATDAAAAKLRDEFARMRKRTGGAINEDASARGIFSSGVSANMMNDAMTQLDLQEGAGLESLFNNAAQQQLAFQLEQERAKSGMYGGGPQRFDSANTGGNTNQALAAYYSSKKNGMPPGGQGMQGTQIANPSSPAGGGAAPTSRRDASSEFYRTYGKWPAPDELDAFMSGSMGAYNPNTDQSMALPGTTVWG